MVLSAVTAALGQRVAPLKRAHSCTNRPAWRPKTLLQDNFARVLLVTIYHLGGPGDAKCYFPTWVVLLGPGHTK